MLKNKYRNNTSTFDNEKMIAATLTKAPPMYSSILASVLREKGAQLRLSDMQDAVKDHWRIQNNLLNDAGNDDEESDDDEIKETALNALANMVCYHCKKKGHKANNCPEKKNKYKGETKGKFKGTCSNCGKRGHKIADCWELKKNKHKRPTNWKSNSETGNVATEYFLMCYEVSDSENESENKDMASYNENENNEIEDVDEAINSLTDAVEDAISSCSGGSVSFKSDETQNDEAGTAKKEPKYQKATAEEATKYIRRYYKLMHKQMVDEQYEEWRREEEAKGISREPRPWEKNINPNIPASDNHPLLDLFHREIREYDDDSDRKISAEDDDVEMKNETDDESENKNVESKSDECDNKNVNEN